MDQGSDQEQGIHIHFLKIKALKISFDHLQSCMPAGQIKQSLGTVQANAVISSILQSQHIPARPAPNIQNTYTWGQIFDQKITKRCLISHEEAVHKDVVCSQKPSP